MSSDWLSEFKKQYPSSEKFYAEMDSQLGTLFEKATRETLERFQLLPSFGRRFEIKQDAEVFSFVADLLNIDILFSVQIAWTHQNEVHTFWWLDLPIEQIKTELANRRNINFGVEFKFEVEIKDPVWPHLQLILQTELGFKADQTEQIIHHRVDTLDEKKNRGFVHRVGELKQLKDNYYQIGIDFGSTGLEFLTSLLKDLETCYIKKVTLDSALTATNSGSKF
jgi:hypothetical protein